jgi:ParB family chromosome partitioning protein
MRDDRFQGGGIVHCRQAIAKQAERLPDGSGWLPKPLRQDDTDFGPQAVAEDASIELPAFLTDDDEGQPDDEEERQHLIAAE